MNKKEILIAYKNGEFSKIEAYEKLRNLKENIFESPLSEGQKGLWMLHHINPDMYAYNLPLCFHINQ